MARKLIVEIVGDSSSLEKSFKRSSTAANRFGHDIGRVGRGSIAASGVFQSLGRSVAFASAGFLGGFGLVAVIKAAFDEMSAMQKVAAQTATVIESTGGVAGVTAKHVDELGKSLLNLSGVDDELIKNSENLLLTFTNVRNVMGKNNDIFDRATKAALNLSVRFDKDLAQSAVLVGKALQDPVRGLTSLQRVGVQFSNSQRKLIKNLVESGHTLEAQKVVLGELEIQTRGAAAAFGETLAGKIAIAKQILLNLAGAVASSLLPALTDAADQLDRWLKNPENQKRVVDDLTESIQTLGAAFQVLAKSVKGIVSAFQDVSFALGLFLIEMERAVKRTFLRIIEPFSHLPMQAGQWARDLKSSVRAQVDAIDAAVAESRQHDPDAPAGIIGPITRRQVQARERFAQPPGEVAGGITQKQIREQRTRLRQAREATRQEAVDRAGLAVDRAALTKSLADDLAALNKLNALLKKRIAGGHATIQLEQQQLSVEQQITALLQQQAEARKAARDARQFRILGFGPTGEDLVPGVKALKSQLRSVTDAIEGTFLNTGKTRNRLNNIRKVLADGVGHISNDVRAKIKQLLDDLKAQLKQSSVDVTRFQQSARGQFGLAGAHGGQGGGVVITGPVHIHGVQNVKDMENQLLRRSKQRAHARRGTR